MGSGKIKMLFLLLPILVVCGCHQRSVLPAEYPAAALREYYLADVNQFSETLRTLQDDFTAGRPDPAAFQQMRLAFKSIEFLLEYLDEERYRLFNGPPVIAEDHSRPSGKILKPQGLQVLAQWFAESPSDLAAGAEMVSELKYQAKLYRGYLVNLRITEGMWIDAIRLHLIRMETLNLAGFDQVGTDHRYAEIAAALTTLGVYLSKLDPSYRKTTSDVLQNGLKMLSNWQDATGDPLVFTREVIQPLRKSIVRLPSSPPLPGTRPYDLHAISLYDPSFLNPAYFNPSMDGRQRDSARIALGRRLFFDPVMSASGTMSCASCHDPQRFFTDGTATAFASQAGLAPPRNTPTLINAALQSAYMYDGRAASLEDQMIHVFGHASEFNTHAAAIADRLNADEAYRSSFRNTYPEMGGNPVNLLSITGAMAAYIRTLSFRSSPFDRIMRGEVKQAAPGIAEGFQVFMGKGACGTCHFPPVFSGLAPPYYRDSEFENLGVPGGTWEQPSIDGDRGRGGIYGNAAFDHWFKTPTLRNVAETMPYFHNGIAPSLEEVIDFYDKGGGAGAGLDYPGQTLPRDSLHLSAEEVRHLLTFLESLTDRAWR